MMRVTLKEIIEAFDQLVYEEKQREQIAFWASQHQAANDADNLEFEPPEEQEKIWRAITYLMGVDLKNGDGSYLHSIENFIDFRKKIDL